jgi:hypothetical protein
VAASAWQLIVLAIVIGAVVLLLERANELFVLKVRERRVEHRRGRIPNQLLEEIGHVVTRDPSEGTIRVVTRGGRAHLIARGFSKDLTQQLRNVVGLYPIAKIRAGRKPR